MSKTPFTPLLTNLCELLVAESYSERTLRAMRPIFKALQNYLKSRNLDEYTTEAGRGFMDYCEKELKMCQSHIERAKNIVGKLDRMLRGIEGRDALLPWPLTKYELSPLLSQLYELLASESYTESTLRDMRFILNALQDYLKICNLKEYTSIAGAEFIGYCSGELKICPSRISRAKNIIGKLNRMLQGVEGRDALLPGLTIKFLLPQSLSDALDSYIAHSAKKGNRSTTSRNHYLVCGRFLQNLVGLGCIKIQDITGENIQAAFLAMDSMGYWQRLSPFFLFLFEEGILKRNYSTLVQYRRRMMPMPSVYSPKEIIRIESSFDLTSPAGIRNYAIALLITRYGIRSADVAALTFENIDFDNNRIHFAQQKTDDRWEIELLPEVKAALLNYTKNIRIDFGDYPNIFMKLAPPYAPLDFGAINTMVQSQFKRTDVDSTERKRGSRALRSSVASNMINDGISTEIVRKVLGHGTKHALRHYARIDVESMRLCPLPTPEPTGEFARLLFPKGVKSAHV
jgi:integrase